MKTKWKIANHLDNTTWRYLERPIGKSMWGTQFLRFTLYHSRLELYNFVPNKLKMNGQISYKKMNGSDWINIHNFLKNSNINEKSWFAVLKTRPHCTWNIGNAIAFEKWGARKEIPELLARVCVILNSLQGSDTWWVMSLDRSKELGGAREHSVEAGVSSSVRKPI